MSAAGRRSWHIQDFPAEEPVRTSSQIMRSTAPVVGLRTRGSNAITRSAIFTFFRSLPRACIGLIVAVSLDALVMVGYAIVLLTTGVNNSAFYFAACLLVSVIVLVYFTVSAIRSENTVELLAIIGIGTCVNATVFYFRANDNAFESIQRREEISTGAAGNLPPGLMNVGIISWFVCVQLALMGFGYLSYQDFGWRIFKLFGIDFNMRQVYERFLWFSAMLKLVAAGLELTRNREDYTACPSPA